LNLLRPGSAVVVHARRRAVSDWRASRGRTTDFARCREHIGDVITATLTHLIDRRIQSSEHTFASYQHHAVKMRRNCAEMQ
jgi:hypothetical protein